MNAPAECRARDSRATIDPSHHSYGGNLAALAASLKGKGGSGGKPVPGKINVDIRDSTPDWTPFEAPKAPEGAPNVLYVVLDDVGFSAMSCYGGPIETPNVDRVAAEGVRYTQWTRRRCARQRGRAC